MGRTTHYTILGVEPDATQAQIKRAYRDLAKVHHPDVSTAGDAATRKFSRIAAAYKVLSDPAARRTYDRSLREPEARASPTSAHDPRPHYTWTNIAAHGAAQADRANREEEIDELYDTFFSPTEVKARKKPSRPSPAKGKTPRRGQRAG